MWALFFIVLVYKLYTIIWTLGSLKHWFLIYTDKHWLFISEELIILFRDSVSWSACKTTGLNQWFLTLEFYKLVTFFKKKKIGIEALGYQLLFYQENTLNVQNSNFPNLL